MRLTRAARHQLRTVRLFVVCATPAWLAERSEDALYAYARAIGLPIRVLVAPGVRLPEDAFVGVDDLQVAVSHGVETDVTQLQAWLEALPNQIAQERHAYVQ